MIDDLQGFREDVVAFARHGQSCASEYVAVVTPRVGPALNRHDKVRVYYQIGDDCTGIEPSPAWEDIKRGMQHHRYRDRIAVVTDVVWIRYTMRVLGFLMPCEMRIFPAMDMAQAASGLLRVNAGAGCPTAILPEPPQLKRLGRYSS